MRPLIGRREQLAAMDFEHGVAFLIAEIKSTKPSAHTARITIEFGRQAQAGPVAWHRYRHNIGIAIRFQGLPLPWAG